MISEITKKSKNMKTIRLLVLFALVLGCFNSCSKDDDNAPEPQEIPINSGNNNSGNDNSGNNNSGNNNSGNGDSGGSSVQGLQAIDLGLSVKWANYNVGAKSMEEYGDLYAWGETSTKASFENTTYQYYHKGYKDKDGITIDSVYYDRIGNEILIDYGNKQYSSYDISKTEYDVAHVKWGGNWRMPTSKELKELIDNCTWKWASVNEIYGYKVTGKNGNYIFLPASGSGLKKGRTDDNKTGNYMSSTLVDQEHLSSSSSNIKEWGFFGVDFEKREIYYGTHGRTWGYSVRPVSD